MRKFFEVVAKAVVKLVVAVFQGGRAIIPLKSYTSKVPLPPHHSGELPAQSMLQPDSPLEANEPPFWMELPQSVKHT